MASFFPIAVGLITYTRCQVIPCVTKESVCHHTLHANQEYRLWDIPQIIAVKINTTSSSFFIDQGSKQIQNQTQLSIQFVDPL